MEEAFYAEVIDSTAARGNSNLEINGILANAKTWEKFKFYPNNGVVGQVIGSAYSRDGEIYLFQCGTELIVPILPKGLRRITFYEAQQRYSKNRTVGFEENAVSRSMTDEIMSMF